MLKAVSNVTILLVKGKVLTSLLVRVMFVSYKTLLLDIDGKDRYSAAMDTFQKIIQLLTDNHIVYTLTEHEPVKTSEEAARVRGVALKTGTKAMIVKAGESYILIVLPGDQKIDWKKVKKELHTSNVRLATREEAEKLTGLAMGSVPPFGNILDLPTYFDVHILENEMINFNAGSLRHSIMMHCSDLVQLVQPKLVSIIHE